MCKYLYDIRIPKNFLNTVETEQKCIPKNLVSNPFWTDRILSGILIIKSS